MVQLIIQAAITGRVSPYQELSIDCDNMEVVNHGNSPCHPLREEQPQADVLQCFKNLVLQSHLQITFAWVASHQYQHKKKEDQTLSKNLNVEVDKLTCLDFVTRVGNEECISSDFPLKDV